MRARNRLAALREGIRTDDRGETVEKVILIGLTSGAALAVGWAIQEITNQGIGRWELW